MIFSVSMVKVYANPGLLPIFELWQEKTGADNPFKYQQHYFHDKKYHLFIEALDEGSNWSDYNMWTHLDEYYEDNSDYDWWKYGSRDADWFESVQRYPYMDISGLPTRFGKQEDIKEKLVARLTEDRDWTEPLFEVEIYEPYETVLDVSQMSSESLLSYEARIRATPDALRENGKPVLSIYTKGNYVTLVSLGNEDVGEAWLNSIYFTLQPGEAWPKPKPQTRTINHPGGIQ